MNFKLESSKDLVKELIYKKISRYDKLNNIIALTIALCLGISLSDQNINSDNYIVVLFLTIIVTMILMIPVLRLLSVSGNKLLTSLILKYSEKKFNTIYGIYDATIDEMKYEEKLEDYCITVNLNEIKAVSVYKDIISVRTKKIELVLGKKQFEKDDIYYKVLEIFKDSLAKNKIYNS